MTGNVWEWVNGWITVAYPDGPLTDPPPAETGYLRVMRGASWLNFPNVLRLSVRLPFAGDGHTSNVGRPVRPGRAPPGRLRRLTRRPSGGWYAARGRRFVERRLPAGAA